MRIHILSESSKESGGSAKCAYLLYDKMKSDGQDVEISNLYGEKGLINFSVIKHPSLIKVLELIFLPIVIFLFSKKNKQDTIIACHFKSIIVAGIYKSFINRNCVVISWVHTNLLKYLQDNKRRFIFCSLIKYSIRLTDKLCFVGKQQAQMHKDIFHDEEPDYIHNVVTRNTDKYNYHIEKDLTLSADINLLYVGRLSKEKNITLIIKAFEHLIVEGFPIKLSIIGEGDEYQNVEKIIQQHKLNQHIRLLGFREPSKYYKNHDLILLASSIEGFPLVLQEAASYGLPIVSTDCLTGPREVLTSDSNFDNTPLSENVICSGGVLTPVNATPNQFADGIKTMISDINLYRRCSSYLYEKSMNQSTENIAEKWVRLIRKSK